MEICQVYVKYVLNSYGQALVIFDSYEEAQSTKDETHRCRAGGHVGAAVSVSKDMRLTMPKKAFLSHKANKQALNNLLAAEMTKAGISVEHAKGDADYLIALSACASSVMKPTAVIAEDSDIFQLLLHHCDDTNSTDDIYFVT